MLHPKFLAATLTLAVAVPVAAQDDAYRAGEPAQVEQTNREDDGDFPWGLLGLIGLAGLIPTRQQREIRVDARRHD